MRQLSATMKSDRAASGSQGGGGRSICRAVLFFSVGLLLPVGVQAQEEATATDGPTRPEDTEILLPTEILEIEAFDVEVVDAPLPEFADLRVPELSVPLPDAQTMRVTDAALQLEPIGPTTIFEPVTGTETSVFSTARVGVGTRSYLLGDVSVYALGSEPRFNFQFRHESLDGFGDNSAGTGYFQRSDVISAGVEFETGRIEVGFDGRFEESEDGLQTQAPYYSVDQRNISGESRFDLETDGPFYLSSLIEGANIERRFVTTEGDPPADRAWRAAVSIRPGLQFERVELAVDSQYGIRGRPGSDGTNEVLQRVGSELMIDLSPDGPVVLDGSVGVLWRQSAGLMVPFHVGLAGTIRERLNVNLSAGLRDFAPYEDSVWRQVVALGTPSETLPEGTEWFGRMGANWVATTQLTVDLLSELRVIENGYDIAGFDADSGRYKTTSRDLTRLGTELQVRYQPTRAVRIGWVLDVDWIDRLGIDPLFELGAETELLSEGELSGLVLTTAIPFFSTDQEVLPSLPLIGLNGFYSVTDSIEVSMGLHDILSAFRDVPRARYGNSVTTDFPFIEPGFRASFSAQLSL